MYPNYPYRYPQAHTYQMTRWNPSVRPYPPFYSPYSRTFPDVNPDLFMKSAKEMEALMTDAHLVLEKMVKSKNFAFRLMSAAQQSNTQAVHSMIQSTGVKKMPKIDYNPDGFKLNFNADLDHVNCCHLSLTLRWM
ncbi:hypothetical protein LS684_17360 [Cytobacillus spongiae]|uniref:hypothetical protein n=1 Tax=Cytobacillus spongiae TaxID=2901381 RepID=UPI001F1C71E2|nr:hypothetical protein [Cytobacillus spongiae]UII55380.1 hypothetical protein LS684_17360 [Cytobacillus spongiae]